MIAVVIMLRADEDLFADLFSVDGGGRGHQVGQHRVARIVAGMIDRIFAVLVEPAVVLEQLALFVLGHVRVDRCHQFV
jgi:hypothetical protein